MLFVCMYQLLSCYLFIVKVRYPRYAVLFAIPYHPEISSLLGGLNVSGYLHLSLDPVQGYCLFME